MTPNELATEFNISPKRLRHWLREQYTRPEHEKHELWVLTPEVASAARARSATAQAPPHSPSPSEPDSGPAPNTIRATTAGRSRSKSDEAYVIDLCDEALGERGQRQHRFPWLVGDAGTRLPVDAYYPEPGIVVEYRERQHDEPVAFFDRRETVSGVHRGEQRRLYDERREQEVSKHGLRLVIIRVADLDNDRGRKLRRNHAHDRDVIERLLRGSSSPAAP